MDEALEALPFVRSNREKEYDPETKGWRGLEFDAGVRVYREGPFLDGGHMWRLEWALQDSMRFADLRITVDVSRITQEIDPLPVPSERDLQGKSRCSAITSAIFQPDLTDPLGLRGHLSEDGTSKAHYNLKLSTEPLADVKIVVLPWLDGNHTECYRFGLCNVTLPVSEFVFTPRNWNIEQKVEVLATDDDLDEYDTHPTGISHTSYSADLKYNAMLDIAKVDVTVRDNDVSGFVVNKVSVNVMEGGATDAYTVVLTSEPFANVTVSVTNVGTVGNFAVPSPSKLNFTWKDWNIAQVVTVTATNDDTEDVVGSFSHLDHSLATDDLIYAGLQDLASVKVLIADNDKSGIELSTREMSAVESNTTTLSYSIRLTSEPWEPVVVYPNASNECYMRLESERVCNTSLASESTSLYFGASNWSVWQNVSFVAVDDWLDEADVHSARISHSSVSSDPLYTVSDYKMDVTVSITDNDVSHVNVLLRGEAKQLQVAEGGVNDSYVVYLSSEPLADVKIVVLPWLDGNHTECYRFGLCNVTLPVSEFVFTPRNWNIEQKVEVLATDDDLDEYDTHPTGISHTSYSADLKYNAMLDIAKVDVTVRDNDVSGFEVNTVSVNVAEGGATDAYTVVLTSEPFANVTVSVTNVGTVGNFAVPSPSKLNFTWKDWNIAQVVTVTATNDDTEDVVGSFSHLDHSLATDDLIYAGLQDLASVKVLIADNDKSGIELSTREMSAVESNTTTLSYSIRLTSEPWEPVVVYPNASNECYMRLESERVCNASLASESTSLYFGASNWSVWQNVSFVAVDDWLDEADVHSARISHSSVSSDPLYTVSDYKMDVTVSITDNDVSHVNVLLRGEAKQLQVAEGGVNDSYVVYLSSEPLADVKIVVLPWLDGNHTECYRFGLCNVTLPVSEFVFTPRNWNIEQKVEVLATDDDLDEYDTHPTGISHTSYSADLKYNAMLDIAKVDVTVRDNDVSGFEVNKVSVNVMEGGATDAYTVVLTSEPFANVTVSVTNVGAVGNFAVPSPSKLSFTWKDWNIAQVVTVTATNDDTEDVVGSFSHLDHSLATDDLIYAGLQDLASVKVLIADNDKSGIELSTREMSAVESNTTTLSYSIRLTSEPWEPVVVYPNASNECYMRLESERVCNTSLASESTSLYFGASNWSVWQNVSFVAVDDWLDEGDVWITDNDVSHVNVLLRGEAKQLQVSEGGVNDSYVVYLSSEPVADVKIVFVFTPRNWNIEQKVEVLATDDDLDEYDTHPTGISHTSYSADLKYNAMLVIAKVDVTVRDNDVSGFVVNKVSVNVMEGGATDAYTVVLTSEPFANVTVSVTNVGTVGNFAVPSPSKLNFTWKDWNIAQVVTVTATNDDTEDVVGSFSHLDHSLATDDLIYAGLQDLASVKVLIADNDKFGIELSTKEMSAVESNTTTLSYSIRLTSEPWEPVVVYPNASNECYMRLESERVCNASLASESTSLYFGASNWSVWQNVSFVAVDDWLDEADVHSARISHSSVSSDPLYTVSDYKMDVTVSITDNDVSHVNVLLRGEAKQLQVGEGGVNDSYVVYLSSEPLADVKIVVLPWLDGNHTECYRFGLCNVTLPVSEFVFTPRNWNIEQKVEVLATDDDLDEYDTHPTGISHTSYSADLKYNAMLVIAKVDVTVRDNDVSGFVVNKVSVNVMEGGATDAYTVVLTSEPFANVTVSVTNVGTVGNFAVPSPSKLNFTWKDWNIAQVVTVTATNDDTEDVVGSFSHLDHSLATDDLIYAGLQDLASVKVLIADNDKSGIELSTREMSAVESNTTTLSYSIRLTSEPWEPVVVYPNASNECYMRLESERVCNTSLASESTSLYFGASNWSVWQNVSFVAVDDWLDEADVHSARISHSSVSSDPLYTVSDYKMDVTVSITDNDVSHVNVLLRGEAKQLQVAEGGVNDSYVVYLSSEPLADVKIVVLPWLDGNHTECYRFGLCNVTLPVSEFVFTPRNWNIEQKVEVLATDDDLDEYDTHPTGISHTSYSADLKYNAMLDIAKVDVTVRDNDVSGFVVNKVSVNVMEGGATDAYTVVLTSEPFANVTVSVTNVGAVGNFAVPSPSKLSFTWKDWNIAQVVTVTATNDDTEDVVGSFSHLDHSLATDDLIYAGLQDLASVKVLIADNDKSGIELSTREMSAVESNTTTLSYSIRLTSEPWEPVVVYPNASNECYMRLESERVCNASLASESTSLYFGASNWSVWQNVSFVAVDDWLDEADVHSARISHSSVSSDPLYTVSDYKMDVTVSITDNDVSHVNVLLRGEAKQLQVAEGGVNDSYVVYLSSEPLADVKIVVLPWLDGNHTECYRFGLCNVTLPVSEFVFTPRNWNIEQKVEVLATDDDLDEYDTHPTGISHTSYSADLKYNAMLDIAKVDVTVRDNDVSGFVVNKVSVNVMEGGATDAYTVVLTSEPFANVTVSVTNVGTVGNFAVPSPSKLNFTWKDWNIAQVVTVTATNDDTEDVVGSFSHLDHSLATDDLIYAGLQDLASVKVLIADNDKSGIELSTREMSAVESNTTTLSYSIRLTSEPWEPVVVYPNASNECYMRLRANADYKMDVTVSITDNDVSHVNVSEGGVNDSYVVYLSSEPVADVKIVVLPWLDGNHTECYRFGLCNVTLPVSEFVFTPRNWNIEQKVEVLATDDDLDEYDTHPTGISHTSYSADLKYNAMLDIAKVDVTVRDNDVSGFVVNKVSVNVMEGGATDAYTVVLTSEPFANVTVSVTNVGTVGNFAVPSPSKLNFTWKDWNIAQVVTVTATNDDTEDVVGSFSHLNHSLATDDLIYAGLQDLASVKVLIADNDKSGIELSTKEMSAVESNTTTLSYSIRLTSEPWEPVVVYPNASNECYMRLESERVCNASLASESTSLYFGASNWSVWQNVSFVAVDDWLDEADVHSARISHSSVSSDPLYTVSDYKMDVTVSITDNDVSHVNVLLRGEAKQLQVAEGGVNDSYVVYLSSEPLADVKIVVLPWLDGNHTECYRFGLCNVTLPVSEFVFTPRNWNIEQKVEVLATDDDLDEYDTHPTGISHTSYSADLKYNAMLVIAKVDVTVRDNDVSGFEVNKVSVNVMEGGATDAYTVVLTSEPFANVTVSVTNVGTVGNFAVPSPSKLSFTWKDWNIAQVVTVTATNDDTEDVVGSFSHLDHSLATDDLIYAGLQDLASVKVLIADNDKFGIELSTREMSAVESNTTTLSYSIRLTSEPWEPVVVYPNASNECYMRLESERVCNASLASESTSLYFGASNWSVWQNVSFVAVDDWLDEADVHSARISHSSVSSDPLYTVSDYKMDVTVSITDNDVSHVNVLLRGEAKQLQVAEGGVNDSYVVVTVTATNDDTEDVVGSFSHLDHSLATDDLIYAGLQDLASVKVLIADNDKSGIELSTREMSAVESNTTTLSYSIRLTSEPWEPVVVYPNASNECYMRLESERVCNASLASESTSLYFGASNWSVWQNVSFVAVDDWLDEADVHSARISHSSVSSDPLYTVSDYKMDVKVWITDNDVSHVNVLLRGEAKQLQVSEGGVNDSYVVYLSSEPVADVKIVVLPWLDGNQTECYRFGLCNVTLPVSEFVFTPRNWNIEQKVEVLATDDDLDEYDTHPTGISHTSYSADLKYNAMLDIAKVDVTVRDNDVSGFVVNKVSVNVMEGGATDAYTVVLTSEPFANVTVSVTNVGAVGNFAVPSPSKLSFTWKDWNIAQVVTVTATNDDTEDVVGSFSHLDHSLATDDLIYAGLQDLASVKVLIADNDKSGIELSTREMSAVESNTTTLSYSIRLTSEPWEPVVVYPNASNECYMRLESERVCNASLASESTSLYFGASNWSVWQNVSFVAVDDWLDEADVHSARISHSSVSSDPLYTVRDYKMDVTVSITDNDVSHVNVLLRGEAKQLQVAEGGVNDSYVVYLSSEPLADVKIVVLPWLDGNHTECYRFGLCNVTLPVSEFVFTPRNWNIEQKVEVLATDDDLDEYDTHPTGISHTSYSADLKYNAMLDIAKVDVTVRDNDVSGFVVNKVSVNVTEGGATDAYTVVLTSEPFAKVTSGIELSTREMYAVESNKTTLSYSIRLTSEPWKPVVVYPNANNDCYMRLESERVCNVSLSSRSMSLYFGASNWSVWQNVSFVAVDDWLDEADVHSARISHSSVSSDLLYTVSDYKMDVKVLIADNDASYVSISLQSTSKQLHVAEGSFNDSYTVFLNSEPFAYVNVTLRPSIEKIISLGSKGAFTQPQVGISFGSSSSSRMKVLGTDTIQSIQLVFTPLDWFRPRVVTVFAIDDEISEAATQFSTVLHSISSADAAYNVSNSSIGVVAVSVMINDRESIPPPLPVTAMFDSSGAKISVTFDSPVYHAASMDVGASGTFSS
eukprot:jgi/Phyca11/18575/fgenesh1_pg.PHYCAscaffold_38_\